MGFFVEGRSGGAAGGSSGAGSPVAVPLQRATGERQRLLTALWRIATMRESGLRAGCILAAKETCYGRQEPQEHRKGQQAEAGPQGPGEDRRRSRGQEVTRRRRPRGLRNP